MFKLLLIKFFYITSLAVIPVYSGSSAVFFFDNAVLLLFLLLFSALNFLLFLLLSALNFLFLFSAVDEVLGCCLLNNGLLVLLLSILRCLACKTSLFSIENATIGLYNQNIN